MLERPADHRWSRAVVMEDSLPSALSVATTVGYTSRVPVNSVPQLRVSRSGGSAGGARRRRRAGAAVAGGPRPSGGARPCAPTRAGGRGCDVLARADLALRGTQQRGWLLIPTLQQAHRFF
eukprot:scaffold85283_cov51-Phaeocystis_antarctica.AAC.2